MTQKELLQNLVADVENLKSTLASLQSPQKSAEQSVEVPIPQSVAPEFPVPSEYRDIVHLTFNRSFQVRLEPMESTPAFLFIIVVPKKYSRVTSGEDLRPKVITYSDGVAGVRLWAEKVFNNFDLETKELIIQDRPFVESAI